MSATTTERPTSHPFNMHTHVHAQPGAIAHAVERNRAAAERFAPVVAGADRLWVVGIGTSWHATLMAEYFGRAFGGGLPVHAIQAVDFVLYPPVVGPNDAVIVVSHTARKSYPVESLERAQGLGVPVALIAGEEGAQRHAGLEHLFVTTPPEGSATYTWSYTAALAVLADIIARAGAIRSGAETLAAGVLSVQLPAALESALATEEQARALAERWAGTRRIWLAGSGAAGVTAMEVALKIKEAAYLMAEGMSTEMMLHGPFQCADPSDLMVLVAPEGAGQARTLDLAKWTKQIPLDLLVVSDGSSPELEALADAVVTVPAAPEPLSAITTLIPLHLFSYWLALAKGTNPDRFHLDDERFARAYAQAAL